MKRTRFVAAVFLSLFTAVAVRAQAAAADARDGGWSGKPFHFPRIQGIDACGTIVATSPAQEMRTPSTCPSRSRLQPSGPIPAS